MRKTYRLLKDTPELRAGAIVRERCDDGTQEFECIKKEFLKNTDQADVFYSRQTVIESPEWFEEVFNPSECVYLTSQEIENFKKLIKKGL